MLKSKPYGYAFPPGSMLNPGETMRVYTQGDPSEGHPVREELGHDEPDPQQRRGPATLVTYTDVRIACTAWGSKSC